MKKNLKLIDLNYNSKIDKSLQLKYNLRRFPCGEFEFSVQENISKFDIEIYQSFEVGKFNDDLMKLQIVCNVLKRNYVKSISYFAPFLPYTRQDKTCNITSSLGSKVMVNIINNCGISKITTYDLHASEIEGYFQGQIYNLSAIPLFLVDLDKRFKKKDIVIVFPDSGATSRFKRFFDNTKYDIAIMQKVRKDDVILMKILGKVNKKIAIILDDIVDSGSTIIEASKLLKSNDVKEIFVYATHGILSCNAVEKITNTNEIKKITITNSLIQNYKLSKKFKIINL